MTTVQSSGSSSTPPDHPFVAHPHATLLRLSLPLLISLIAEPLTGLVDTAFVARLGADALAALGVGTVALSSIFWVFNFLGVGTQTEVAHAAGRSRSQQTARMAALALLLSAIIGGLLILVGLPVVPAVARLLGATGAVADGANAYMTIRLFGAPAILALAAAFGVFRGLQDMRTPLWIALGVNAVNIVLDGLLVLGYGVVPALGIAGVALASVVAQWLGALWATAIIVRRLGRPARLDLREARQLLRIGGDLFVRTALLNGFLVLATRVATQIGPEAGAAHQAVRQFWVFAVLGLDAVSITAQSLVAYFLGRDARDQARRVVRIGAVWSVSMGILIALLMWMGREVVADLLVPRASMALFFTPWLISAWLQPINALAFLTDGVHWGTGDFPYLRNAMVVASGAGVAGLMLVDPHAPQALTWIWIVTGGWIFLRAALGVVRIWPGVGDAPLAASRRA